MTTRLSRHASKKASTSVSINSKLYSLCNFTEADFDQTTNYSLLYAEENSVIEEVDRFEYFAVSSEQENTLTTYYTEGTPFETPLHFSTSTSTSDLLKLDDTRISDTIQEESNEYFNTDQNGDILEEKLENSKNLSGLKSYMEYENKEKECENTDIEIYLPEDLEDCDEERLEGVINVTPSQSPIELCESDRDGKVVTFSGEDRYTQHTPLMFSRCSSLGSLSGYEQHSIHDDRSSIVSDFSRRTSEVVSPSELPDSPAQLIPPGIGQQKDKKFGKKKLQQLPRDKSQMSESFPLPETSKHSIFEDDLAVFKEESTPIKFQSVAASSLSSLTIDDEDYVDEQGDVKSKAVAIKSLKSPEENEKRKSISNTDFEENPYYSVDDEEQILDEYIRKGIAKVTRQNINDVSSFSLQSSEKLDSEKSCDDDTCKASCSSLDLLDENSDLTAEEEKLLDECIRRGIAKVTRQNINDVTSLSLRTNLSGLSRKSNLEKSDKQDPEQQNVEEPPKRTAVCQTE